MANTLNNILKRADALLKSDKARAVLKWAAVICAFIICFCAVRGCRESRAALNANISAMSDTISYYKGKSNRLVAQKAMLEGDMGLLKTVNDSLYNIIKEMKVKNPDNAVRVVAAIEGGRVDTCWVISHDTLYSSARATTRDFEFSDKWRTVRGYTYIKHDTLGTVITKNDVVADFTVVQKDNNVYISSNNPYIEYKNIIGITSKSKNSAKRFGIGPYIGFGITHKLDFAPTIGLSVHYSIIRF